MASEANAPMRERSFAWRRRRGGLALVLGLTALAVALAIAGAGLRRPAPRITLTAGFLGSTRAMVARALVVAVMARGVQARLVETMRTEEELEQVNSGAVDFALVSGAFRIGHRDHVREVAPLYVEALHLMVREDLTEAAGRSLGALRGRAVDLGPRGTATAALAEAVMAFAGFTPGQGATSGAFVARHLEYPELQALLDGGELPDAVFQLATVPSKLAQELIRAAHYRVVALPFADAFRLQALISDGTPEASAAEIDRQYATDTVIPPFTYGTEPAIPSDPLHTVGTRLVLVAHEDVPPETVGLVLDAVFSSRFAHLTSPPLDPSLLVPPPRLVRHPGTVAYLQREKPLVTNETVDELSNTLSILGALVGASLFLWQWRRQRASSRQDETFGSCMLRVAAIERRVVELELSATLELEPLIALQRELLQLKSEALERFATGDVGGQAALSDLLVPLNAARDHIGDLVLHVRENLEERAETEGRSARALWTEAIAKGEEPEEPS